MGPRGTVALVALLSACGFRGQSSGPADATIVPPESMDSGDAGDATVPPLCGNHAVDTGEECDDGNDDPGDGCTGCMIEPAWDCSSGTCKRVTGVSFSLREALASAGSSGGGGTFTFACGAGAAVVGFEGFSSNGNTDMGKMHAACAVLAVGSDGKLTWSTVANTNDAATETSTDLGTRRCANDSIVVGYTANAGQYLSGLVASCVPVSFVHGKLAFGTPVALAAYGPSTRQTQAPAACAAGELTTVFEGKAGSVFDHFNLHCALVAPVAP